MNKITTAIVTATATAALCLSVGASASVSPIRALNHPPVTGPAAPAPRPLLPNPCQALPSLHGVAYGFCALTLVYPRNTVACSDLIADATHCELFANGARFGQYLAFDVGFDHEYLYSP